MFGVEIGPREAVAFGTSSERQRDAWTRRHFAHAAEAMAGGRAMRDAGASASVAEAYASGWCNAFGTRYRLLPEERAEIAGMPWAFMAEYEHASWLFETERASFRPGYANAWEQFLTARKVTAEWMRERAVRA